MGSFVQPTTTDEDGADGINEVVHGVDIGGKIRPLGHGSRRGEKSRQQHDAHHKVSPKEEKNSASSIASM